MVTELSRLEEDVLKSPKEKLQCVINAVIIIMSILARAAVMYIYYSQDFIQKFAKGGNWEEMKHWGGDVKIVGYFIPTCLYTFLKLLTCKGGKRPPQCPPK